MVGGVGALVGTFLPWLASGSVDRSSYDLIDTVERLGFSPDGFSGFASSVWPIAPLLLVLSVVAQWVPVRARPIAVARAALAAATAVYVGGTAVAVLRAPDVALFGIRYGVWSTLAASVLVLGGAVVSLVEVRAGRPTDLAPTAPA